MSRLIGKNFDGIVPEQNGITEAEKEIDTYGRALADKVKTHIRKLEVDKALDSILRLIRMVNKYVEAQAPWKVAKTDLKAAGRILYTATESLRLASVLLNPVMPTKTQQVLEILGAVGTSSQWGQLRPGTKLKTHEALFPRLEVESK